MAKVFKATWIRDSVVYGYRLPTVDYVLDGAHIYPNAANRTTEKI